VSQGEAVVGIATPFVWLGMVLAISFLETPLKFRAPGITLPLGLGIGRLVFRALNLVEAGLAALLTASLLWSQADEASWLLLGVTLLGATVQVAVVRPRLDRRARLVIAGGTPRPSRQHHLYVALEVVKVGLLAALGATLAHGYLA
jgi:Flp pilus assembly protein protease CpaA